MRAEQARQIPIPAYLERSGIKPAKVVRNGRELWYSSPIRAGDDTPSFKVDADKNLWFDHGLAVGGNVIDLVVEMHRVSVKEALAILASGFGGSVPSRTSLPGLGAPAGEKEKDTSLEVVDVRAIAHAALIQYCNTRCVDIVVARRWLKELRYRRRGELKTYFALGFPCGGGFDARSAVFKGFVGTDKDISRIGFADKGTVAVFEGPFDFMSWLSHRQLVEPDCAVIILHSAALRRRALDAIGAHGFGRVLLFLDHDQAGRETTQYFIDQLGNRNVVDRSIGYAGFKDLNDWRRARPVR